MQNVKDFLAIGTADNILLSTDAVENCIKSFLNVINGSPDRFLFEKMFSQSMLSSIDRIEQGVCI